MLFASKHDCSNVHPTAAFFEAPHTGPRVFPHGLAAPRQACLRHLLRDSTRHFTAGARRHPANGTPDRRRNVDVSSGYTSLLAASCSCTSGVSSTCLAGPRGDSHIVPVPTKLRRLPLALRQQDASEVRRLQDDDVIIGGRGRRPRSRLHIDNQVLPAQAIRDGPCCPVPLCTC
ncbi:hypothetical protein HPB52_008366 [Rhipicephalus sanguineus]|uniref:Uncharacterized protein n=1 Tax=Rhipicephalus sanguineus TaxID=34632 RepID=A0A9D4T771_RHISA|nr:hypothetical protein HPB52_008366 [Rhipicephalus sanguineus]